MKSNFKGGLFFLLILLICVNFSYSEETQENQRNLEDSPEQKIDQIIEEEENKQKERERWKQRRKKGDNVLNLDEMANGFNKKKIEDILENEVDFRNAKGKKDNKKMDDIQKKIREGLKQSQEANKIKQEQLQQRREQRNKQKEELRQKIEQSKEQGILDEQLQKKFEDEELEIEKLEIEDQNELRKIYEEISQEELQILKQQAGEAVQQGGDHPLNFLLEWEDQIADFNPDETLNFEIKQKQKEIFLEDITKPCILRGIYYSNQNDDKDIEFEVISPNQEVLVKKIDRKGIFKIELNEQSEIGTYNFVFHNKSKKKNTFISFAIDVSDNDQFLQTEDILTLEGAVKKVNTNLNHEKRQFKFYQKMSRNTQEKVYRNHKTYYIFTIVETIFIVIITFFQVISIKRLLANKSIV